MIKYFSKTQQLILFTLCDRWYESLTVNGINELSKLPVPSIYESIRDLKSSNLVIETNGGYKINFSNDISWAIKRLNDSIKLYQLPVYVHNKIMEIRQKARLFYGHKIVSILVFGSSASGEIEKDSDIDFYIILKEQVKEVSFLKYLTSADRNFNFIENTQSNFQDAYHEGDDFIISILKNHILIEGNKNIRYYLERNLPIISEQVIHDREIQLNKLQKKIDRFILDNLPLLYEKTKEYIKLRIRINFLKKGIIPSSNRNLLDMMRKEYRDYYKAYKELTRKNAKLTYVKLAGIPKWKE